jgi:hypothetical protein
MSNRHSAVQAFLGLHPTGVLRTSKFVPDKFVESGLRHHPRNKSLHIVVVWRFFYVEPALIY